MVATPSPTNAAGVYVACIFLPVLATITVGLRLWIRRTRKNKLGGDDWTIFIGMLLMWTAIGIIFNGVKDKIFGYHSNQNPQTGAIDYTWREPHQVELLTIILLVHTATLGFIKLSIVLLYRRIFATNRKFNIWSATLCVIVVLWATAFFFAELFQCGSHISAFWTSSKLIARYCDDEPVTTTTFCVTDIVTDLLILITPIPMIWRLQMSLAQKVAVSSVFALGLLSTISGLIRAVLTSIFELGTKEGHRDLLAANTTLVVWCIIESASGIIGACLPTIRPLFQGKSADSILRSIQAMFSLRSESNYSSNATGKSQRQFADDEIALQITNKNVSNGSIPQSA